MENDLNPTSRAYIYNQLKKARKHMELALAHAEKNGWPGAVGFCSGEGHDTLTLCIIQSMEAREAQNGSPPEDKMIGTSVRGFDSGAW